MKTETLRELAKFHRYVTEKLTNGGSDMSPEEVLAEWRLVHPSPESFEEDVAAIQEAIDDMQRGEIGQPADEFFQEMRARFGTRP